MGMNLTEYVTLAQIKHLNVKIRVVHVESDILAASSDPPLKYL